VAQGRLAVCSSHAAQAAGLLDVTPSFKFKMSGPHCMRVSLRPSGEGRLAVCLDAGAQRYAHTVRDGYVE